MADPKTQFLDQQAAKALALLAHLKLQPVDSNGKPFTPRLLKDAKGALFLFSRKGGFGLACAFGSGFSVTKLATKADGTATWSAPCFLSSSAVSIGGTVGMHDASSLSCLMSDKAAAFMQLHGVLESYGTDAHLTAISHTWVMGPGSEDQVAQKDAVSVGWSEGFLVDLSIAASDLRVDKEHNLLVYGQEVELRELLSMVDEGGVPAPPQFEPVHARLNEMILSCNEK